jgi:hypothetical protein
VEERIRGEVQKVFAEGKGVVDRKYFPDKSGQIPDVALLTLVVLPPVLSGLGLICVKTGRHFSRKILSQLGQQVRQGE